MFKHIHVLKVLIIIVLALNTSILSAQQKEKIRLLDQSNAMPITEATYQYGTQSGLSDLGGFISFSYSQGEVMILSHVSYGKWELSDALIQAAIESGLMFRESKSVNLYPVTVIALNTGKEDTEVIQLDYYDKMAHDGGSLLNQIPAISSIRKSGNYGFDPVLRGFKYDQLNVVLNGAQGATAACPNRMDPPTSQMAPNMMHRIEVLKGPHALRYGGAFGGTINFIPSPLRFSNNPKIYGRFSSAYNSNGDIFRTEGLIGFSGKRYDLGVYGAWSQGSDYTAGDGTTVAANFQRGSFGADLGLKLSDNQQLRLSATRNLARDVDFPALPMDLRTDDTWMFNLRHDIIIKDKLLQSWNTTLYGSFVDHLMDNLLKPLDPRPVNAETYATTYNYGGRTEGIWGFNQSDMYAGIDIKVEGAEGDRVREFLMGPNAGKVLTDNAWQDSRILRAGAFAEYHLRSGESFQWVFSGRLELNQSQANDVDQEFTEVYPETEATQINPSISIGGIKTMEKGLSLGLWLGRAQRSGSLTERFINYFPVGQDPYEMLGNPQLDPEVNYQADLTLEWKNSNTAVKMDIFVSWLQDHISSQIDTTLTTCLPTSPGVRQYVNLDEAFKTGFEFGWVQKLYFGLNHQLSVAYTYGQDLQREQPLPEISPLDFRYSLYGEYLENRLRPEITFRLVAEQGRVSEEYGETSTPGFTLLDVKLSYRFCKIFSMSGGVQNIFDEGYYEHLNRSVRGTPDPILAPGRNVFVSLNLNFM